MNFSEIWATFTHLATSSLNFRNPGLFHEIRNSITNGTSTTSYNKIASSAHHQPNRLDYANPGTGGSCTTEFTSSGSDQFSNHDFFELNHPGGALNLELTWNSGGARDVDLYLYVENYTLFNATSIVAASNQEGDAGTESINLASLAAGTYMINVQYFSGSTTATYELKNGGTKLCPQTSF